MLNEMVRELIDVPKATILEKQYSLKVMVMKEHTAALVPVAKVRTRAMSQEPEGDKAREKRVSVGRTSDKR
jgi:hypothetical protein